MNQVGPAVSDQPKIEVVVDQLNHPCAVAVHRSNEVFVSESGAGRVLKIAKGRSSTIVDNFDIEAYGNQPSYPIGPLGLVITTDGRLLVGEGGRAAGKDRILAFPIEAISDPIQVSDCKSSVQLSSDDSLAEGNFHGLAKFEDMVYATCHGDDSKGWLARARYTDGQFATV